MKQFWLLVILCSFPASTLAETVYLNGGTILRGKIISRTADQIVIEIPQAGGNATVTLPLDRIRRIGPDGETPETMSEQGMKLLEAGKLKQAEALFKDALRQRPTHVPARIGIALAAGSRNKLRDAIRELRRALLLAPSNPDAWYYLGYYQVRLGKFNTAVGSFRRAQALTSDKRMQRRIKAQLLRIRQQSAARSRTRNASQRQARASWDKNLGSNPDAAGTGVVLKEMLRSLTRHIRDFRGDIYVELKAPRSEESHFAAGGALARYRHAVRVAQVSFQLPLGSWEKLTNREKREIVGGWVRYMKDLYPFATTIAVVSDEKRYLVEAIWVDLQERVRFHWYRTRDGRKK